jgi:molecular chaperone GrpE
MTMEREEAPIAEGPAVGEPETVDGLKALLDEERSKADRNFQNWQRAAADYQNFKRRVEEERSDVARWANEATITNLLPIVDDFERAFLNIDSTVADSNWVEGVRAIQKKLQALLEFMGVGEIPAEGAVFDPAVHEAISQGPGEEGHVIAVVRKGYMLGDRVLRPSMVVVGNGSTKQGTGNESEGS